MKKSFALEHFVELVLNAFEYLLNGSGIADKSCGHLQIFGWNIAHGRLDIIGDPFHEMAAMKRESTQC